MTICTKALAVCETMLSLLGEGFGAGRRYAVGNGTLALVTGERLVEAIGTARSCFFTLDSTLSALTTVEETAEGAE